MSRFFVAGITSAVLLCNAVPSAEAFGKKKNRCEADCAPACAATCAPACEAPCVTYQDVQRTIMVPQMVTETRKIQCVENRYETRERKVTVNRMVPEVQNVTHEYTVMVPEVRSRTEKYMVSKPVYTDQQRNYTVMVPHQEKRQGTRQVCRLVAVKETRKVCEDQGAWQEVACAAPAAASCDTGCASACGSACGVSNCGSACGVSNCGSACGACDTGCNQVVTRKVWVPNIVERNVEVTCMRPQMSTENFEYTVTVCKPEQRTQTVRVCNYVQEEQSREVKYTVCVPQKRTATRQVTVCKYVPEERTEKYTVCVPHTVEREINVQVCKMVEKVVTCKVAVAAPCAAQACNTGCAPCAN